MLLHRFPAAACSREVERDGVLRVQDFELGRAGRGEYVWEVAGDGVSLFV
jgi:hypothetical protein